MFHGVVSPSASFVYSPQLPQAMRVLASTMAYLDKPRCNTSPENAHPSPIFVDDCDAMANFRFYGVGLVFNMYGAGRKRMPVSICLSDLSTDSSMK
jgi:hypothetical protein